MSIFDRFATNKTLEVEGTWIDTEPNADGSMCRFKICRMGGSNRKFIQKYAAAQRKHRGNITGVPTDRELKSLLEAFVDTVLLAWENVPNAKKRWPKEFAEAFPNESVAPYAIEPEYMAFNRSNAIFLFEKLSDLFDYVVGEATKIENFQTEADAEAAKN